MPVTKTAKRALRGSARKQTMNMDTTKRYETAIRYAKRDKTEKSINEAISQVDRAAKKNVIHKNKAARLKSQIAKLASGKGLKAKGAKLKTKGKS